MSKSSDASSPSPVAAGSMAGGEPAPGGGRAAAGGAAEAEAPQTGRLARRLLGRMVVWLAGVAALVFALGLQQLEGAFDAFERRAAEAALQRVRAVLQRDAQTLGESLMDYAHWDDTFALVSGERGARQRYMQSNFAAASMRNLRIDAMAILDAQGRPLVARVLQGEETLDALPSAWAAVLAGEAAGPWCSPSARGLLWLGSTPALLAAAVVRDTTAQRTAPGCMWMLRRLDALYVADLRPQVGVDFIVLPLQAQPAATQRVQPGVWMAQAALRPWPALLQVRVPESLAEERRGVVWATVAGFGVLALLGLGGLLVLLHALVIRRVERFSALADAYRRTQDPRIAWPAKGRDEIDNLGRSLNELVRQVHGLVEHHATHDPLTGLLNRHGLERALAALPWRAAPASDCDSCLMLIDLDHFKVINDGLGHDMGDALLVHAATQIRSAVRGSDVVARLGGDEFAVLLRPVTREAADAFAQRVLQRLRQPLERHDTRVATTASVGLAFCEGLLSPAELLRHADLAMYQAKERGRDQVAHFSDVLKAEVQRRNRLEQALREAVASDGVGVVFQPVVDMARHRVVGMEALARWSLDGEAVSPAEFIPIAEACGLIGRLGLRVLARAADMVARLKARGWSVPCSVNVSVRQFQDGMFLDELPRCVRDHGLSPRDIRLEITESAVAQSHTELALAMRELSEQGFVFQLDDFGTGHSSLYRLQALPLATIKIDRSFVQPLERGDDVLVRTVKDLAQQLCLGLVAEGVETAAQIERLLELDIACIQGWAVARPMSDAALLHWLASGPYQPSGEGQRPCVPFELAGPVASPAPAPQAAEP